jgi:hypothetical protein
MKERRSRAQETAVSSGCRTADSCRIQSGNCETGLEQFVDRRESTAAEADDTCVGFDDAGKRRVYRTRGILPDRRRGAQK